MEVSNPSIRPGPTGSEAVDNAPSGHQGHDHHGQRLGLDVIPEGIERPEDLSRLQALGCATGQGFLLSRPITPGEIEQWLTTTTRVLPCEGYQVAGGLDGDLMRFAEAGKPPAVNVPPPRARPDDAALLFRDGLGQVPHS